ncbi:aspartate/glutamate racemase family protein [Aeromonas veronii]|uniref:aspartate/glutamate racemase family protein n=1 Tax=Aeromonas veronii TaxID=654 RepID=UPI00187F60B4|nr:aspartate/glutamate racemase family protein [Aeromonas veronii]MBE8734890.1 aspartate/glutamate racemase family protein [Aeromonas veronii]MBE8739031.1 aspartate/glutamate racemase family protein [Aeromonas veronii]MBE8744997.1 aspartate/glutamate racemase family protein [Aeromonas veronii]MBE8763802.1 aspartate/glutamate racemase family protein [Aeromonas veronii]MBE8840794.1 aspartate/glutamate racemase family protein [Aeromonas veronii]
MKCIGLLGGMSWESTVSYYQALNRGVRAQLGGLHSARVLLNSVDFAGIERLQHAGDWPATARLLAAEARKLQNGGADFLLIGTNTMHKVAPEIEAAIDIPLLHIADATAAKLRADGITRVGLLGTRFTMEQDFYKRRLQERFGLAVLVPDEAGRERVHRIIYDELCLGEIRESSRAEYLAIIAGLAAAGAEAVILGCTEIALLVGDARAAVPLYDTTAIHAEAAVALALASD